MLAKVCHVLTVGPTVPSMYIDQRIKSDKDYDLNLFESKDSAFCISWLNTRPQGSVVYVAFGSIAKLNNVQMEELASAVRNFSFMWVVRDFALQLIDLEGEPMTSKEYLEKAL